MQIHKAASCMKNHRYKEIRKRTVKYRSVPKRDYRGLTESCFRLIFRSIFPLEKVQQWRLSLSLSCDVCFQVRWPRSSSTSAWLSLSNDRFVSSLHLLPLIVPRQQEDHHWTSWKRKLATNTIISCLYSNLGSEEARAWQCKGDEMIHVWNC